jgi:hypothetical protein
MTRREAVTQAMSKLLAVTLTVSVLLAVGLPTDHMIAGVAALARVASAQDSTTVGIDADPAGNTATSLGEINNCLSVVSGQTFDIDIFITDVVDLFGWDAVFNYDGSVLHLMNVDVQLFQASNPGSQVVNFSSSSFPDTSGSYTLGVGELSQGSSDSGSGVLARLTLEAAGAGTSQVSLTGLKLRDMHGNYIGDANGDRLFDGPLSEATISVDEPCVPGTTSPATPTTPSAAQTPAASFSPTQTPSAATPQATATGNETAGSDSEFPWAVVCGSIAGAAVIVLVLSLLFVRLTRRTR